MDTVSAVFTGGSIALTAVVIVVLVKVFTFSLLAAGVTGVVKRNRKSIEFCCRECRRAVPALGHAGERLVVERELSEAVRCG